MTLGQVLLFDDSDHSGETFRVVVTQILAGSRILIKPLFESDAVWSRAEVHERQLREPE